MTHELARAREIIRTDVDSSLLPQWKAAYILTREAILTSRGFKLERAIIRPSGESLPWRKQKTKGKGFHCWWHILCARKLTDMEKLQLQFLLGDDLGRLFINYKRITERHNPHWDKIFGYVDWRIPLEPRCEACRLRKTIEEIKTEFEYGGLWLHASEKHSKLWKQKGARLVPPVEDFHVQLVILKQVGLESRLNCYGE